ncbi:MAG: HDIG domain-containing metalloprotein [Kiritimatiellales bacterium]
MKRKLSKQIVDRVAKDIVVRRQRCKMPMFNILTAAVVWLGLTALFYSGRLVRPQPLVPGQHAPETIIASVDFLAETIAATELHRRAAADDVLPVFRIDHRGITQARQALTKLVPRFKSFQSVSAPEQSTLLKSSINDLLDLLAIPLAMDDLLKIFPNDDLDFQEIVLNAVEDNSRSGIVTENDLTTRFTGLATAGKITIREPQAEVICNLSDFVTQPNAVKHAAAAILKQLSRENQNEEVVRRFIMPWMVPNVVFDSAETAARRAVARDQVEPVLDTVDAGTILVRSGDTVTEQTLKWLAAHERRLSQLETPAERIQRMIGSGFLLLLGIILSIGMAGIVRPDLISSRKHTLMLFVVALIPILIAKLLLYLSTGPFMVPALLVHFMMPLALAPLLATVLLGGVPGLITGFWSSYAMASLMSDNFYVFISGMLVTITVVFIAQDVKRRATLFRAGFWAGMVKAALAVILAALIHPAWKLLLPQLGSALASGIISALLVMLLIPVFEQLFKITTDITLLELSDLSHPLLQSLAIQAPGTYHHSLMMASVAQNAAEAIGANGLLVRVCAYYHDIGKLVKPGFFTENIQYAENPHDELTPTMSTLVIVSHVKEGITLAKKYKLPQVVIDGIQQHQGTALVSVFYHRAKIQSEKEGSSRVNDEDFRYEGPLPQTREMGILMLADSCEAASRSLDKPSPVRIAGLVNDIFNARLRDGQLDHCPLTLAELYKIKDSIIFSLTNMNHGRIAYPKDENNRKEPAEETPAQPAGHQKTDG